MKKLNILAKPSEFRSEYDAIRDVFICVAYYPLLNRWVVVGVVSKYD